MRTQTITFQKPEEKGIPKQRPRLTGKFLEQYFSQTNLPLEAKIPLVEDAFKGLTEVPLVKVYPYINLRDALVFSINQRRTRKKQPDYFDQFLRQDIYETFKATLKMEYSEKNLYSTVFTKRDEKFDPFSKKDLQNRLHHVKKEDRFNIKHDLEKPVEFVDEEIYKINTISKTFNIEKIRDDLPANQWQQQYFSIYAQALAYKLNNHGYPQWIYQEESQAQKEAKVIDINKGKQLGMF